MKLQIFNVHFDKLIGTKYYSKMGANNKLKFN